MLVLSQKTAYLTAFSVIALLLGVPAYLEIYAGVVPCPLCMVQRILLGGLGIIFLLGLLGCYRFIIGSSSLLVAAVGFILSSRQVWLQHTPVNASSNCELSLRYMMQVMPFDQLAKTIFMGGSACSQIGWQFFHVSLAEWACVWFLVFSLFGLRILLKR